MESSSSVGVDREGSAHAALAALRQMNDEAQARGPRGVLFTEGQLKVLVRALAELKASGYFNDAGIVRAEKRPSPAALIWSRYAHEFTGLTPAHLKVGADRCKTVCDASDGRLAS
jgi:hypothetical protein